MRTVAQLVALSFLVGCAHKVGLTYIEAAAVDIDTDLEKVLVINRSLPGSAGERVLGAAEGLATGEGFALDVDASALALDALLDVLDDTDRYEVISFRADGREVDTSLWDHPLDAQDARRLCKRAECDAIIALDALDTDTVATMAAQGRPRDRTFTGRTETDLVASFRVYDADGRIVDEVRLSADAAAESSASNRVDAAAALGAGPSLQAQVAAEVGAAYGRRIAPHEVSVERRLYRTGAPELGEAWRHAKDGRWAAATRIWRGLVETGSAKDAAKAGYNLAVAAEARGDLDAAARLSARAHEELDRGRIGRYVDALAHRRADHERLAAQLEAPEAVARR